MRRFPAYLLGAALAGFVVLPVAQAGDAERCYADQRVVGEVTCETVHHERGDGGGRSSTPRATYPYSLLWKPVLLSDAGEPCLDASYVRLGREPTQDEVMQSEVQYLRWVRLYPSCPDAEPPPATTPEMEAELFLRSIRLPRARPYVAPGELLAGMEAFLETDAPTTRTYGPEPTPHGDLVLVATADIFVDWDDPHDDVEGFEGPFRVGDRRAEPGPWPDGEITHVYQHDGRYEIVVRYEWRAEWSIGATTGTITGVETVGTYPPPGLAINAREPVGSR